MGLSCGLALARRRSRNIEWMGPSWTRRDPRSRRRRCGFLLTGALPHLPETSVAMELSGFPGRRPAAHVLSNVCTDLRLWDDSLRRPMPPCNHKSMRVILKRSGLFVPPGSISGSDRPRCFLRPKVKMDKTAAQVVRGGPEIWTRAQTRVLDS